MNAVIKTAAQLNQMTLVTVESYIAELETAAVEVDANLIKIERSNCDAGEWYATRNAICKALRVAAERQLELDWADVKVESSELITLVLTDAQHLLLWDCTSGYGDSGDCTNDDGRVVWYSTRVKGDRDYFYMAGEMVFQLGEETIERYIGQSVCDTNATPAQEAFIERQMRKTLKTLSSKLDAALEAADRA